jgi:hypothetical protein
MIASAPILFDPGTAASQEEGDEPVEFRGLGES